MTLVVKRKILWVVAYDSAQSFLDQAKAVGATGVAIRTDNDIANALPAFHSAGIEVYGWRWPSANRDPAMLEAKKVAGLLRNGMDGYYVDPEGEPGKPYDWNKPGLAQLASDFCQTVKNAAPDKPLGVTSHYLAKSIFPNLPWKEFFAYADILLPQSYWRVAGGNVGHGIPGDNYARGIEFWTKAGGEGDKIVPMGGEIGFAKATEIGAYAAAATAAGRNEVHFYTSLPGINPSVLAAIKAV